MKSRQIAIAILAICIIEIKLKVIESTCGIRLVGHGPLITNGFPSNEGDWPWHAAIYHIAIDRGISYKCGGTVLDSYSVLTAAHCVYENNRLINPERVSVQLGKYNLKVYGTSTQDFEVFNIIPHPSFNTSTLSNDIAIIRLATQAAWSNYVQPICLSKRFDLQEINGKLGTVIGWGVTETDQLSLILRQAFVPVVSSLKCLQSDRVFFGAFLSENNFCAGFRNGTSLCNGDSGGGIFFEENGVYYISGIVSLAKSRMDKHLCSTKEYVIFTHIAPYLPWIEKLVPQLESEASNAPDHLCLYRPGTGTFWILKNTNGYFTAVYRQGDPGNGIGGYDLKSQVDKAFAFDYQHTRKLDHLCLYRPGTGTFWILKNTDGHFTSVYQQGDPGNGIGGYDLKSQVDKAFAFDYQHTGKLDHIVLYRPGTGTLWILQNTNGVFTAVYQQGDPGIGIGNYDLLSPHDRVIAFDFDHSGKLDHMVLYRPGDGLVWILKNTNGLFEPVFSSNQGIGGYDLRSTKDRIFGFDYTSSGKVDHLVLYRPGTGTLWILKNQRGIFTAVYAQGDPGVGIGGYDLRSAYDMAFAFDYKHNGKQDHIVLYRPGTGTLWILQNQNGKFEPVFAQSDPGRGVGHYDLKSVSDRVFAMNYL